MLFKTDGKYVNNLRLTHGNLAKHFRGKPRENYQESSQSLKAGWQMDMKKTKITDGQTISKDWKRSAKISCG